MKYLLVLLVVVVAYMVWRAQRRADAPTPPPAARPKTPPQDMVACQVCGVHMPRGDAITGPGGLYCSDDHRRQAGD